MPGIAKNFSLWSTGDSFLDSSVEKDSDGNI